jgi:hypothetical protein
MSLDRLLSNLSFKSIQESIEFVERADLKTVQIDDLKAALDPILRAFGCFAKRIGRGEFIYRAMKHQADEKCFANVSRIYPDPRFLKRLGRANREHQAIFYLSGDPVVALYEVNVAAGDTVSVLTCRPLGDGPLLVPMGIDELMRKRGAQIRGDFPESPERMKALLKNDPDNLGKYGLIDTFLTKEFLKNVPDGEEHEYKTSIAIAESLFSFDAGPGGPIDGIAYPSLAAEWSHANVALLPESFHRNYEPTQCQQIKIKELRPNLHLRHYNEVAAMANGIKSDGTIDWEDL